MRTTLPALLALPLLAAACLAIGAVQAPPERRPLDHDAYARWSTIEGERIALDGSRILYERRPVDGADGELRVEAVGAGEGHAIARGRAGRFSADAAWVVCELKPARDDVRAAKEAKRKKIKGKDAPKEPKAGLAILSCATGELETIEEVESFRVPEEGGSWVAWRHVEGFGEAEDEEGADEEPEEEVEAEAQQEQGGEESEPVSGAGKAAGGAAPPGGEEQKEEEPEEEEEEEEELTDAERKKRDAKPEGTRLVVRELGGPGELVFEDVTEYTFDENGARLAFVVSTKDGETDGVHVLELATGEAAPVLEGPGIAKGLAFDRAGGRLAFLANRDDWQADAPAFALYLWEVGAPDARRVAGPDTPGLPAGWSPSEHRAPSFSETGRRLWFGTAARPVPDPEPPHDDEQVDVDVWAWTDDVLQPQQLEELDTERERSYLAVAHLDDGARVVQLATPEVPSVRVPSEGEADVALGTSDLAYRRMRSWDAQVFHDVYAVDVATGERTSVVRRERGSFSPSPDGRHAAWWDGEARAWHAVDLGTGRRRDLTGGLDVRFDNERHDTPALPGAAGRAGWVADGSGLLVYDRYDVWKLDPSGERAPVCVTDGLGREERLRLRVVDLDPDHAALAAGELLLSGLDEDDKAAGFWRGSTDGGRPSELLRDDARFGRPVAAQGEGADRLLLARETFREFPDLWTAAGDLSELERETDVNPQAAEYLWGDVELTSWTSSDGIELEGLLYKPEGFDPERRYPLVTYFYERSSDNLHAHHPGYPHRSVVRISFYTSRGYVVFVPDIPYAIGSPGQSAVNAVVPGVLSLVERGLVDPERIGVQGHSWGGYQIAYLVTRTDLFRCAIAGAPVANMTSAYGGIRWGSGMSRMFQYEKTQSRIGATLWEASQKYVENSPVFFADDVETPLLILHNDRDGAVPWYQGIELFVALRRLDKPAWMLNYNGQPHWVTTFATQKDYATRMQQFLDHHLLDAPPARWMVEGVPALEKGRTLGLELVEGRELDR